MSYPDEKFKQVLESLINPLVDSFKSAFESCEKIISRVKSVSRESTDEEYPTAKAVYTFGEEIKNEVSETYEKISNRDTEINSNSTNEKYPTTKAVYNAFQKAIYTAVEQAGSITVDGGDFASISPNLFNKDAEKIKASEITTPSEFEGIIEGASLDNTTGEFFGNSQRFITPFIPVEYGKAYTTVQNTTVYGPTARMHLYDTNFNWLGVLAATGLTTGSSEVSFTIEILSNSVYDFSNVAYARFSHILSQIDNYMVVEGDTYPGLENYQAYGISLKENVKIPQIKDCLKFKEVEHEYDPESEKPQSGIAVAEAIKPVENVVEEVFTLNRGGNLFDKTSEDIIDYAYLSNTDGAVVPYLGEDGATVNDASAQHKFITHYIPVETGKMYTVTWDSLFYGATTRAFLYDSEFNYLGISYSTAPTAGVIDTFTTFTINKANVAYMRFNSRRSIIDNVMVVEGDSLPEEYIHYGDDTYSVNASKVDSPLKGKIISFNGDSICAGAGASGGYGKIIAQRCGMKYENIGVSGGTIMYSGDDRHCISRTVVNMREDADYVILEGGVNDLYSDRPLGSISDGYNAELDDTTFYGAFENMLKQALIRFHGKKIGYIAVHKMTDYFSSEVTENSAYYAALECCKKWGIPVCDLNISCPPFAKLKANNETAFLADLYTADTSNAGSGDGWHPNEEGYLKYYCDPIEKWLLTL